MTLATYTTPAEVRAVLGVSTTELPDAVVNLPIYETGLELALEDVASTLQALYVAALAVLPADRTTTETKLIKLVGLYSAYIIARDMLTSLSQFTVSRLTDGKAEFQRYDGFDEVREGVNAMLHTLRTKLTALLVAIGVTDVVAPSPFRHIGVVALNKDPVTDA